MNIDKKFINAAIKAYDGIARPEIENKKLVLREIHTNKNGQRGLRPFITGQYEIKLSTSQILKIRQWI